MGGKGTSGGWYGWSEDPELEQTARRLCPRDLTGRAEDDRRSTVQKEAYDQVIYVPLGQFQAPSAWRKSVTGVIDGPATPMFWNVNKND